MSWKGYRWTIIWQRGVRISKYHGDRIEILSLLNFDLKKASDRDVKEKVV